MREGIIKPGAFLLDAEPERFLTSLSFESGKGKTGVILNGRRRKRQRA
jgi:hypothetical protein